MALIDTQPESADTLDVAKIKRDFPLLDIEVNGKPLVYLDSASSSQKPQSVLDVMDDVYATTCLLYTSPSPRDRTRYRMPSSA